jgi:hypothetical protein
MKKKIKVDNCHYTIGQYVMVTYLMFVTSFLSTLEIMHLLSHLGYLPKFVELF